VFVFVLLLLNNGFCLGDISFLACEVLMQLCEVTLKRKRKTNKTNKTKNRL